MPNTVHFLHNPGKRHQRRLTVLARVKIHFEKSLSVSGCLWNCERPPCAPKRAVTSRSLPASTLEVTGVGGSAAPGAGLGRSSALSAHQSALTMILLRKKPAGLRGGEEWENEGSSCTWSQAGLEELSRWRGESKSWGGGDKV